MVARDKARVRTQMSAGLSRDDLDEVLRIFESAGKEVKSDLIQSSESKPSTTSMISESSPTTSETS